MAAKSHNKKIRLDDLLVERELAIDRLQAERVIRAGVVYVNDVRVDKPGTLVPLAASLRMPEESRFVSRAGDKLQHAITQFGVNVSGKVCADVGAATGGFSDVLLQAEAAKVYAVDVGYGDLAWKVRSNPRLIPMERTNVRNVATLPEQIQLVVIDVSFISLRLVLPVIRSWLSPGGEVLALVKPQFEAPPERVGEGGIIRDVETAIDVVRSIVEWAIAEGFAPQGLIASPILGAYGNREFLLQLRPGHPSILAPAAVEGCVRAAFQA